MLGGVAGIDELLAIRRNIKLVAAADGERRRIEGARRQIARRAAAERHINDMGARRLLPRFPVAEEEISDHSRLRWPLFRRGGPVFDACRIDAAIRITVGDDEQLRTV